LILSDCLTIFGCKSVNCDEMDGDRPRLPANRNCHRLLRVSWALAQISCLTTRISLKLLLFGGILLFIHIFRGSYCRLSHSCTLFGSYIHLRDLMMLCVRWGLWSVRGRVKFWGQTFSQNMQLHTATKPPFPCCYMTNARIQMGISTKHYHLHCS